MDITEILQKVIDFSASDLHLTVGSPPVLRIEGKLTPLAGEDPLTPEEAESLIFSILSPEQKEILLSNKEVDFSFSLKERARFRVNAYHQKGYLAAALRFVPLKVPTIEELNLPKILYDFAHLPQGFVLVTGPASQGKSTTIAAILNEINEKRADHIITIEDPIEFVFPQKRALIEQRELYLDTHSWSIALRSCLREDPDVVFVGEMRDYETIASAVTLAETGHLVFSTLHTNSASGAIDRIIDVFPEHQQQQIRMQLSVILEGVLSQRLLPAIGGGRVPAVEVLLATPAVRNVIREGKTHQLDNIISTSAEAGMITLEQALARLVRAGRVELNIAKMHTPKPEEVTRLARTRG